jgi:hypothetical protein
MFITYYTVCTAFIPYYPLEIFWTRDVLCALIHMYTGYIPPLTYLTSTPISTTSGASRSPSPGLPSRALLAAPTSPPSIVLLLNTPSHPILELSPSPLTPPRLKSNYPGCRQGGSLKHRTGQASENSPIPKKIKRTPATANLILYSSTRNKRRRKKNICRPSPHFSSASSALGFRFLRPVSDIAGPFLMPGQLSPYFSGRVR